MSEKSKKLFRWCGFAIRTLLCLRPNCKFERAEKSFHNSRFTIHKKIVSLQIKQ